MLKAVSSAHTNTDVDLGMAYCLDYIKILKMMMMTMVNCIQLLMIESMHVVRSCDN